MFFFRLRMELGQIGWQKREKCAKLRLCDFTVDSRAFAADDQ